MEITINIRTYLSEIIELQKLSLKMYTTKDLEFIRKYKDHVDWEELTKNLPEFPDMEFIREFKDYIDWNRMSYGYYLSEDFIREFQDKLLGSWNSSDWIACKQVLSEDFIREFQDRLWWPYIIEHQKLSTKFKFEFRSKSLKWMVLYFMNLLKIKLWN